MAYRSEPWEGDHAEYSLMDKENRHMILRQKPRHSVEAHGQVFGHLVHDESDFFFKSIPHGQTHGHFTPTFNE